MVERDRKQGSWVQVPGPSEEAGGQAAREPQEAELVHVHAMVGILWGAGVRSTGGRAGVARWLWQVVKRTEGLHYL